MKMTNLVWPFVLLTAFPACTEIGLDYRKEEGTVVIAPDWSAFACPASACYRFYAAGSEEAAYESEDASAESFRWCFLWAAIIAGLQHRCTRSCFYGAGP